YIGSDIYIYIYIYIYEKDIQVFSSYYTVSQVKIPVTAASGRPELWCPQASALNCTDPHSDAFIYMNMIKI
ncbi:mCG145543, partial [Mus musculus]